MKEWLIVIATAVLSIAATAMACAIIDGFSFARGYDAGIKHAGEMAPDIKALDTKVELHAAVTRLIDERSKENRQRIEKLEQGDKGSPVGDTFPESNDPAECK